MSDILKAKYFPLRFSDAVLTSTEAQTVVDLHVLKHKNLLVEYILDALHSIFPPNNPTNS